MRHIFTIFLTAAGLAGPARADSIVSAAFSEPTPRYDHGILGDAVEWGALRLTTQSGSVVVRLPETRVFEDLAPRLITGDTGETLAMVVETDLAKGARLALYGVEGLYAATPFIGHTHRWLAPVAAGDLDGDGWPEVAYVDRPHLAKTLRVWRLKNGALSEVAQLAGVSNHQIGWDFIVGGLRACGAGPEMLMASGDWRDLLSVRLEAGRLTATRLGPWSHEAAKAALACR